MSRRQKFTDSGGATPGNVRARVNMSSEIYRCHACQKCQVESVLAKSRVARVRCRHCGQIIYLVKEKLEEPLGRTCLHCLTTLRSTNPDPVCALCLKKITEEGKLKAVVSRGDRIHAVFGSNNTWCDREVKRLVWGDVLVDCPTCWGRASRATWFPGRPVPHPSILAPKPYSAPEPSPAQKKPPVYASLVQFCERVGEIRRLESHRRATEAYLEWLKRHPQSPGS